MRYRAGMASSAVCCYLQLRLQVGSWFCYLAGQEESAQQHEGGRLQTLRRERSHRDHQEEDGGVVRLLSIGEMG